MDGEMPIALLNSNGVLQYWNTSYGKYVKVGTSYSAQYYLKDHLGSVRVVLDQSGNRTQSQDYYAYGLTMPTRSYFGNTKEGFTGKETDLETGLQYFGARYYMPHLGRWMAIDPLADKYPSHSPYTYVMNRPTVAIDPNGKDTWFIPGTYSTDIDRNRNGLISATESVGWDGWLKRWQYYLGDSGNRRHEVVWTGGNSRLDRRSAANDLVNQIVEAYNNSDDPNFKINIVAHSHGGNVVIEAVNRLADLVKLGEDSNAKIKNLKINSIINPSC